MFIIRLFLIKKKKKNTEVYTPKSNKSMLIINPILTMPPSFLNKHGVT
jgi:hypothetical protein